MAARSQAVSGHPGFQAQTSTQHLRERQRFFEDVLQHDVDLFYPPSRLLSERWRPSLDSVSSMEVNFDTLELSDPLDISDTDPSDAFQQSEDPTCPTLDTACSEGEEEGKDLSCSGPSIETPVLLETDLTGFSCSMLHFPITPTSDERPAHDEDTVADREESPRKQSLRHCAPNPLTPGPGLCHCSETPTSEIK